MLVVLFTQSVFIGRKSCRKQMTYCHDLCIHLNKNTSITFGDAMRNASTLEERVPAKLRALVLEVRHEAAVGVVGRVLDDVALAPRVLGQLSSVPLVARDHVAPVSKHVHRLALGQPRAPDDVRQPAGRHCHACPDERRDAPDSGLGYVRTGYRVVAFIMSQ